ncbi:MAG: dedA family protein [Rhodospirillales bacterium]|nr:dedA family protein [Rhodospirillales bacterium]
MIDFFQHLIDTLGYFGVFLLLFIENIFPPLPSEVVAPFCGYAAARGELNIAGVIAAAVLGSMVGQMPWYYAGRLLGEKRIEALAARYGRWLTVTPSEVRRVFGWFARFGAASVFFGRMIPAIRAIISLPAGIAELPLAKFLAYSLAGTTLWMGGLAYAGYRLGQNYELVAKYMEPGTKIVVALVVFLYVARLALSFRKPQSK